MDYLQQLSSAIEMFRKLTEDAKNLDEQRAIAEEETKGKGSDLAETLLELLENKEVSLRSFDHPTEFAEPEDRRRLFNFVEFNYFVALPSSMPLKPQDVNYILRNVDRQEWEMYAEILGNRFSLKDPEPVTVEVQAVTTKKPKSRTQKQAGK